MCAYRQQLSTSLGDLHEAGSIVLTGSAMEVLLTQAALIRSARLLEAIHVFHGQLLAARGIHNYRIDLASQKLEVRHVYQLSYVNFTIFLILSL